MWGEFWETKVMATETITDTAYTSQFIGPHTDCTYLRTPSGLQIFHALQPAKSGGVTMLVDAFTVAKVLQERDPMAFTFLSETSLPFYHYEKGHRDMRSRHTVFEHETMYGILSWMLLISSLPQLFLVRPNGTKRLVKFRYNDYDRALLDLTPSQTKEFYRSWRALTSVVRDPANTMSVPLRPGSVIFINNERYELSALYR